MNNKKLKAIIITAAIILATIIFVTLVILIPKVLLIIAVCVGLGVAVFGIYKMVYLSLED
jgi:hypothetical protein